MPVLLRLPPADGLPAQWELRVSENERDEVAHAALESLLPPEEAPRAVLELDPGGAAARLEFERCESCPVMKWRAAPGGGLCVSLARTTIKGLAELWELATLGGGEFAFEILDCSEDPRAPVQTYFTLRGVRGGD